MSEAEIIEQVIAPNKAVFSREAAQAILKLQFDRATTVRIRLLL